MPKLEKSPFTALERALIRREFYPHFGQQSVIANGISIRTWKTGLRAGQRRFGPAIAGLVNRGLMEIRTSEGYAARAYFTEAGYEALRLLALDRPGLDPVLYAHVLQELGLGQ